jgi:hypothetical protein
MNLCANIFYLFFVEERIVAESAINGKQKVAKVFDSRPIMQ